jgi:hypothetical protein
MKVYVEIYQTEVEHDSVTVDGIRLTCERCGHYVEIMGTSDRSASFGAVKLREECPNLESNYYAVDHWA